MGIWWGGGDTAPRTSVSQHPQAVGRPCLLSYPLYRWVYPQESICRGNAGVAFVQAKPELKSRLKSQGICGHKVADFQLRAVWGSLLSASHSFSQTAGTAWGLGRVEGEKWKHKTENVSSPSLLAELGTRTPFSGFQGLIWPSFCQVLLDRVVCHVRALVVLPTKELAQQVCGSSPSLSRAGLRDRLVQPVLWLFCGAGWRPASGSDAAHVLESIYCNWFCGRWQSSSLCRWVKCSTFTLTGQVWRSFWLLARNLLQRSRRCLSRKSRLKGILIRFIEIAS